MRSVFLSQPQTRLNVDRMQHMKTSAKNGRLGEEESSYMEGVEGRDIVTLVVRSN
jgi:hypothetical protein